MSNACEVAIGAPSLARDVLASTDCFIATRVEQAYAQLTAPGGSLATALTIGLTIYVAITGYRLVLGQAALTLGEVVPHFVKIGLVLAALTSWPTYQRLVFDSVFDGPQQIAATVMTRSDDRSPDMVIMSLQTLFDDMTGYAGNAWGQRDPSGKPPAFPAAPGAAPAADAPAQASPVTPAPVATAAISFAWGPAQFVALALWGSALAMLATSIGLLLIVRIILAVLLMFGPVFVALAMFGSTRSLFEGWLRATAKFALVPLVVLPLAAVLVAVLAPFVRELAPGPILAFRDTPALAILMIVVVFAAVLSQALALTGMIAGAIRLPRRIAPAAPVASTVPVPSLPPIAQPSRAEIIASMVAMPFSTGSGGPAPPTQMLVGGRRIDMPPGPAIEPADYEGRLGQALRSIPPRTSFAADMRNPVT